MSEIVWLSLAAFFAGVVNAVAGGGTLLTFPALFAALGADPMAAVIANATSTVALCPGSIAGTWGYRRELATCWVWFRRLLIPCLLGGIAGSVLVVWQDPVVFRSLVPWLILAATSLLLFQPLLTRWTGIGLPHSSPSRKVIAGMMAFQFVVAVYGGYFGAGMGILMLGSLAILGIQDIHQLNALKASFASVINAVSVVIFVAWGIVRWDFAIPMIVTASLGGYLGAATARRMNRQFVRWGVILLGFSLTAYYWLR